jgi:hypothetical protein
MPNHLISYSDRKVVLRNHEGCITTYEEPETYVKHDVGARTYCRNRRPEPRQGGVHALLQGEQMWIEPSGIEEIHGRGSPGGHRRQDPSKWVPYGVGAILGQASGAGAGPTELPVLKSRAVGAAGGADGRRTRPAYGPGEEPRPREGEPTAVAHGELL